MIYADANDIFFNVLDNSHLDTLMCEKPGRTGAMVQCLHDGMKVSKVNMVECYDEDKGIMCPGNSQCQICNTDLAGKCPDCDNECAPESSENCYIDKNANNNIFSFKIINITDEKSELNGKPYSFYIAFQNRHPVLDWIHKKKGNPFREQIDIVATPGDEIIIDPYAYDPDEDFYFGQVHNDALDKGIDDGSDGVPDNNFKKFMSNYTKTDTPYSYSGWKETYDEWFNYECCDSTIRAPDGNIIWNGAGGVDCSDPDLIKNCMKKYADEVPPGRDHFNSYPAEETAPKWTTSYLFTTSDVPSDLYNYSRRANIITHKNSLKDIGYHEVAVTVTDMDGKTDMQTVRILVTDIPYVLGAVTNLYADFYEALPDGPKQASLEDSYKLDASASSAIFFDDMIFTWKDNMNDFSSFSDVTVVFPEPQNIDNILSEPFKTPGTHTINLEVTHPDRNPTFVGGGTWTVTVHDCLPHLGKYLHADYNTKGPKNPVNSEQRYYAPWPYSVFRGDDIKETDGDYVYPQYSLDANDGYPNDFDPFQATHSCCNKETDYSNANFGELVTAGGVDGVNMVGNYCYYLEYYTCKPQDAPGIDLDNDEFGPAKLTILEIAAGELGDDTSAKVTIRNPNPGAPNINIDVEEEASDDSINDLYLRKYGQQCSGNRGNACSGIIVDTWERNQVCNDLDIAAQDERCEAPFCPADGINNIDECLNIVDDSASPHNSAHEPEALSSGECYKYPKGKDNTFEKQFLGLPDPAGADAPNDDTADGWCGKQKCVEGEGDGKYPNPGKVKCYGTCDGEGNCDYAMECVCDSGTCGSNVLCDGKTSDVEKEVVAGPPKKCCDSDCEVETCKEVGDWMDIAPNTECITVVNCDKDGCDYTIDTCNYRQATLNGNTCWFDSSGDGDYCDDGGAGCDETSIECPEFCINDNNGEACAQTTHNTANDETCYWSRSCTDTGCTLTNSGSLRKDKCDVCASTGVTQGGDPPCP